MTVNNAELVRDLFDAVRRRDVDAVFSLYDPEVVIREAPSLPYGGEYRGHEGALAHGLGYLEAWDALQTEEDKDLEPDIAAAGDQVYVRWRQKAHRSDGEPLDLPCISVYELRAGRIVTSAMHHLDTAAILEFLDGATPPAAAASGSGPST